MVELIALLVAGAIWIIPTAILVFRHRRVGLAYSDGLLWFLAVGLLGLMFTGSAKVPYGLRILAEVLGLGFSFVFLFYVVIGVFLFLGNVFRTKQG